MSADPPPGLDLIEVHLEGRAVWATIDNPPVNLITRELLIDLLRLTEWLLHDPTTTVLVLQSADPEFFLAHFDVSALLESPPGPADAEPPAELNVFDQLCERFRTAPQATIGKIAGRVGGGGSEIAMACDMRFAALETARMNQMEVLIGIIPGGGGTQRLPGLVGFGRAAELILGGVDLDAETGERWGYFNRALPAVELDAYVDGLARRIASFPPDAVREAKAAMVAGVADPTSGLIEESSRFARLNSGATARRLMQRFLDLGGQTREGERRVDELSAAVAAAEPTNPAATS